jgi:hypothetical protein
VQVSIALSLLLSELAAPPFDQLICTFSAKPRLHRVTGNNLAERVRACNHVMHCQDPCDSAPEDSARM